MEKTINTRIIQKHATETEWNASTMIPLNGELIIYDTDSLHAYKRLKIGDGTTSVADLPFIATNPVRGTDYWTEADKSEIKSYVDEAILGGAW